MKYIFLTVIIGFSFLFAAARQKLSVNDPNTERRNVTGFHAIRAGDGIDIYLIRGNEESIAVSASKTVYPKQNYFKS